MNYAYLSGFLQAEMKNLADDSNFLKIKDADERLKYLNRIIKGAEAAAKEYSAKMGAE